MKKFVILFSLLALLTPVAMATPIPVPSKPVRMQPGNVPKAAQWNATIPGIYTYMNTVVALLNQLTTKGDQYIYDGGTLARLAAGANSTALTVDSAQPAGVKWVTPATQQPMTTKGDIVYQDAGKLNRLPVGADGTALGLIDGIPSWIDLSSSANLPRGSVVPYNFTFAGSTSIPAGFAVCDGTSGTPNLIGLFVLGTRPVGSSASAASGGYGAQSADAPGIGTTIATHGHAASYPSGYTGINPYNLEYNGAMNVTPYGRSGSNGTVAAPYHTHPLSAGTFTITQVGIEPSDYAMVYLIKQ